MNTFDIFKSRRDTVSAWLQDNKIAAAIFIDNENCRCQHLRYLSNMPSDGILVVTAFGTSILCPWDENLAKLFANVETIVPFTKYDRDNTKAIKAILKMLKVPENSKVEIPPQTTYPDFLRYVDGLSHYDILCREKSSHQIVEACRKQKDSSEISYHKEAAKITDKIIDKIEASLKKGKIKTETDVALLIEKELRTLGAESTSFDTLAAGPDRSFGIHAFPSYTANDFATKGLSILDFGVKYNGYCSDVTITIAKGVLTEEQEKQLELVQRAYNVGLKYYQNGVSLRTAAVKVDEVFAKAKRKMPHSLGHGVGLDIHEYPFVRASAKIDEVFMPGMIVTLEPGLYDPIIGGCRLENDILITEDGNEVLTHSRIIRIP